MARTPYQVLVIPFIKDANSNLRFALFRRADRDFEMWQPITGGGEEGETNLETAVRETAEETGMSCSPGSFIELKSRAMIPADEFPEGDWGPDVKEIPEYSFGVEFPSDQIVLSDEHTQYVWLEIEKARTRLHWKSNVRALDELFQILIGSSSN